MEFPTSWTDLQLYHWLAIAGGAVVLLAIVLYFTPINKIKIPAIVGSVLGGLALGAGAGVIVTTTFSDKFAKKDTGGGPPPDMMERMRPGGPQGMPGGFQGMPGGTQGRPGPGGVGQRPNAKNRLAELIVKLDVLTSKPLTLTLTDEQKKKVREQIQKLDAKEELEESEARNLLLALQKILDKDQHEVLASAGFRWPGSPAGRPPADVDNPFSEKKNGEHLKSLRDQVAEKK
jgi:hypothetical protein